MMTALKEVSVIKMFLQPFLNGKAKIRMIPSLSVCTD